MKYELSLIFYFRRRTNADPPGLTPSDSLAFPTPHAMPNAAINLWNKFARFADHGSPRIIAETGDCQLKLVKVLGREVWRFPADRVVIVLDGEMTLGLQDDAVSLSAGEMYVVPRDTEHCPMAEDECSVMLVEPKIDLALSVAPVEAWV